MSFRKQAAGCSLPRSLCRNPALTFPVPQTTIPTEELH